MPIDLTTLRPRARAVLRLLALNAGVDIHHEYLLDAFWPDVPVAVATRRLQVAISSIRHRLEQVGLNGLEWLPRHGEAYRLKVGYQDDVRAFSQHLSRAAADRDVERRIVEREAALNLYAELLPEDGAAEHVVAERERYRLEAARACAALARDQRSLGRLDSALEAASLSIRLDRFQDTTWNLLAQMHQESGDPMAAKRVRQEHAAALAELEAH